MKTFKINIQKLMPLVAASLITFTITGCLLFRGGTTPNQNGPLCKCGFLERSSKDQEMPIKFDPELNEYNFIFTAANGEEASMRIYHCPFCGGRAPESKRGELFAKVSKDEISRLSKLTENIHTLEDALRGLGEPDVDDPNGMVVTTPERGGNPETTEVFRVLTYKKLSKTADVFVSVLPNGRVAHISFGGKYIGKN
jgi:hypothetical protein